MIPEHTNVGKWDSWYEGLDKNNPSAFRYGDTETYRLGAEFLQDCDVVEDWGVGAGGFKRYRADAIGVDGSRTPFADRIADLTNYITACDGIFLRHVLDHNWEWEKILRCALASAKKKICIVLFVPFSCDGETRQVADNKEFGVDVPDLAISGMVFDEILEHAAFEFTKHIIPTQTGYGKETVLYLERIH